MAFVHHISEEHTKSNLALTFQKAPTQFSIEKRLYIESLPLLAITETAPIDLFLLLGMSQLISNTLLYLCSKLVKDDATHLDAGSAVSLVNSLMAPIFIQLDVPPVDCLIRQSNSFCSCIAFLELVLNYSNRTFGTQFSAGLVYKGTLRQCELISLDGCDLDGPEWKR